MSSDPDEELMARLRGIAADVDGVPDLVGANARAAFATRRLDDELAELLRDSDLAAPGVRGAGPRLLTFETADLTLELQLDETAGRVTLSGLAVGSVQHVEVETAATSHTARPDDGGWFRVDDLPAAPFRVRATTAAGPAVSTGWIRP